MNDKILLDNLGIFLFGRLRSPLSQYDAMKRICVKDAKKQMKLMLTNADALGVGETFRTTLIMVLKLHGLSFTKK
ncbi:hypothetical protein [Pelotalea chapellei]|uniref:Uncharacterized protein n=1 Tax=Pelotalea chapellei TaxID=44671 RepID=A0ABS5U3R7_9BACT|nr:hypothetical protein [Pelotalea chapellei]MBT1070313.1 hypothetical protein [Pelotalea chapellei]